MVLNYKVIVMYLKCVCGREKQRGHTIQQKQEAAWASLWYLMGILLDTVEIIRAGFGTDS